MKTKKFAEKNMESKKSVLFYIGLSISLALAMMAFEYRTPLDHSLVDENPFEDDWSIEEEEIPVTLRKQQIPSLPEPEFKAENKSSLEQQMKIVEVEIKPILSQPKPSSLPEIPVDFEYYEEGEEFPTDVIVDPKVFEVPIEGYLPVFCDCRDVEDESERESCNTQVLNRHLQSNLRFPTEDKLAGRQGRVRATYVINTKGEVSEIEIIKSPSDSFSKEAKRVIEQMPCIVPASQHKHNVAVRYSIPINFVLH